MGQPAAFGAVYSENPLPFILVFLYIQSGWCVFLLSLSPFIYLLIAPQASQNCSAPYPGGRGAELSWYTSIHQAHTLVLAQALTGSSVISTQCSSFSCLILSLKHPHLPSFFVCFPNLCIGSRERSQSHVQDREISSSSSKGLHSRAGVKAVQVVWCSGVGGLSTNTVAPGTTSAQASPVQPPAHKKCWSRS